MSLKTLITNVKDRLGHDKRYAIDSSKIKSELNWEPKYSFDEGIEAYHRYLDATGLSAPRYPENAFDLGPNAYP